MHTIITKRQDALADVCRRFQVSRLEVFGSAATDEFGDERSDLDFLVDLGPASTRRFDRFFGLQRALSELFDRPVDLVEDGAPRNPYFIRRLNESRRLVYAA